jgi:hypothetical protein
MKTKKRRVSQKAQRLADGYAAKFTDATIQDGAEFDVYCNGRYYTFSLHFTWGGYYAARFEHHGCR